MRIGKALRQIRHAGLLLMALSLVSLAPAASLRRSAEGSAEAKAASRYGQLPMSFEENRGQTDQNVRYLSRGSGYTLFLTEKDAVLSLASVDANKKTSTVAIRLGFAGSRGSAGMQPADLQPGVSNYLMGSDQSKWLKGLAHYGRVNYKSVYPGVDAVFYGNQRQLEYDFVVAPNADAKQIRLNFDGVEGLSVNAAGELVLKTSLGDLVQGRPIAYQTINGVRKPVGAKYQMMGNQVAFNLARYDRSKPLVIDPTLQWSTFLGGTGLDSGTDIAVDSANNAYVVGYTSSANFPASLRFGGSIGGASDAFVVKYSTDGRSQIWSTFLSGEGTDQATGVAVNDAGVTVVGYTDSSLFPLVNARQGVYGALGDAFITKILRDGSAVVYSTYIGGTALDIANDVALDAVGGAVVVGTSNSSNFQPSGAPSNGGSDAFVVRMKPDGADYEYRILIGSSRTEAGFGVAVDSGNNAYVVGRTDGIFFRGTPGVVQQTLANAIGIPDGFLTKLSPTGGTVYQTLLGGSGNDEAVGVDVDSAGNAYVFGNTDSVNYPTTTGAFRTSVVGGGDTFVTKLNPTATARIWSTYLGGTSSEGAEKIRVVRSTGVPFLVGTTASADFPLVGQIQSTIGGSTDIFLTELTPDGASMNNSTYFGGIGTETSGGLAIDGSGNLYIAGTTTSSNLPILNPGQPLLSGTQDAFVTKLSNCTVTLLPNISGSTPGRAHSYVAEIGSISITGPADCAWVAVPSDAWITLQVPTTGSGNGVLNYVVSQNFYGARTGSIAIGNQRFTIQQAAGPISGGGCVYPMEAPVQIIDPVGINTTFNVSTSTTNCPYTVSSDVNWLLVGPVSGTQSQPHVMLVSPNHNSFNRAGIITVRDTGNNIVRTITVTQTPSGYVEVQRFITLSYSHLFGRYPSLDEINFHSSQLLALLTTRTDILTNFMQAEEFNQTSRFVAGLYRGLLGRDPEFAGWLYQRTALRGGIASQTGLVANFLNSAEFNQKYGVMTNEQFVALLYNQVIGRPGSPAEIAGQANQLNTAQTNRVAMANQFLNTPEFTANNATRITGFLLYAGILGRNPSTAEIDYRTSQLSFTPLRNVVNEFAISPELMQQTQ